MKSSYRDAVARKEKILEMLILNGNVRVTELSEKLNASSVTIRSDLYELQEMGMLTRTHGGAVMQDKAYLHISRTKAMMKNIQKKNEIAAVCMEHINDGDTIIINSGTTGVCVARELFRKKGITLLTNSITALQESPASLEIILMGGCFDHNHQYTCGDDTLVTLKRYMADKLILTVDGVTKDGLTTQKRDECAAAALMMQRSRCKIILADSTKINKTALSFIAPMREADILITNKDADPDTVSEIKALGVQVILA